jgi:hypothetical protein
LIIAPLPQALGMQGDGHNGRRILPSLPCHKRGQELPQGFGQVASAPIFEAVQAFLQVILIPAQGGSAAEGKGHLLSPGTAKAMAGPGGAKGTAGVPEEGGFLLAGGTEKMGLFCAEKGLAAEYAGNGEQQVNKARKHANTRRVWRSSTCCF